MSVQTLIPSPGFASTVSSSPFDTERFDEYVMTTYGRFPLTLVRGEGCRVWDDRNQSYLDFVAGIATCTLGHANPVMVEAATRQMQTLHHVSNLYYIPQQGELAQWLVNHSCADKVFFCNSGAEANEGAIKLARKQAHVKRGIENPVIITAHASFHGRTLATITATGQPKYQKNFAPLVPGFHYVPYNDITALEAAIADLDRNGPQVAAIMMEALQGEGGVNPGDRAYFQRIREICDETGILLILDEVGQLSYSNRHADLLFQVIAQRYEKKSTCITTNRPFSEWSEIFPNATCVVSIIDRLVHHSEILTIEELLDLPIPIFAYASPPSLTIGTTAAIVSTLFTTVGQPQSPAIAGNGGLILGLPRLPSNDSSNAVSSPQMYAPPPG